MRKVLLKLSVRKELWRGPSKNEKWNSHWKSSWNFQDRAVKKFQIRFFLDPYRVWPERFYPNPFNIRPDPGSIQWCFAHRLNDRVWLSNSICKLGHKLLDLDTVMIKMTQAPKKVTDIKYTIFNILAWDSSNLTYL